MNLFHTQCTVIFIMYFHTKFHILSPSSSYVIAIKPKTKENVHTATRLLFYVPQHITVIKLHTFKRSTTTHNWRT